MGPEPPCRGAVLAAAFAGLVLGLAADPAAPAAQPAKKAAVPADFSPGVVACIDCHHAADRDRAKGFAKDYGSDRFVRLDEGATWVEKDPHSLAFAVLGGDLGKQMAANLGYDVTKAPQCLTCHAVDLTPAAPPAEKAFYTKAGVSCAGCHGLKESWQIRHYKESPDGSSIPWRTAAPAEKEAAGMHDLRNPVVKARLCVSCHVGSPAAKKVVSHAMFAAGHPPLPPFELVTYTEAEPRHWGYPAELPFFDGVPAEKTWPLYRFHKPDREVYAARHLAAGAVAALRAECELLAADAAAADGAGLDFARFDCYACHHDLRHPSDRQKRGYPDGPPGRPTLRVSTGALAGAVADHAAGAAELKAVPAGFAEKWTALRRAAASRPFGDPPKVKAAADEVIAWCDEFLRVHRESDAPLYPPAGAKPFAAALAGAATADRHAADPEAAFALTWAYTALCRGAKLPFPEDKLAGLAEVVPPSVRVPPYSRKGADGPEPVTARFADRMKAVNGYEAARFRERFGAIIPMK
jgi:hypothetical protein